MKNSIKSNIVAHSDEISVAIESLQKSLIKLVLVLDNQKLVGTISDGDIRRALLNGKNLQTKCNIVMNNDPQCALVGDIGNINKLLTSYRFVPLIDKHNNIIDIATNDNNTKTNFLPNPVIIMAGGQGKRLLPLTLNTPKPLLKLNNVTMLETSINLIESLGIKKIIINTFYLRDQISNFLKSKNFNSEIKIIDDGENILNTGGGILNMMNHSDDNDFLIFNPDTLWKKKYLEEIVKMEEFYFSEKVQNILLLVNKNLSFDKALNGDFNLENDLINDQINKKYIYTGCQIINRNLFKGEIQNIFSIYKIWKNLIQSNKLYGFESKLDFYHLTDLEIFKKLKDF